MLVLMFTAAIIGLIIFLFNGIRKDYQFQKGGWEMEGWAFVKPTPFYGAMRDHNDQVIIVDLQDMIDELDHETLIMNITKTIAEVDMLLAERMVLPAANDKGLTLINNRNWQRMLQSTNETAILYSWNRVAA